MPQSLDLIHLKMIHTLAHSATVKDAADKLFISQPALSSRIKEAERRLGTELFIRHGRRLVINSAGKRLLHSAERILKELDRAQYDIGLLSDGGQQVVRLGLPYLAPRDWLAAVYQQLAQRHPQLALEVVPLQGDALNALRQGQIDIALMVSASRRESDDKLHRRWLFADTLQAVVPHTSPQAQLTALSPVDFERITYITNSAIPERDREHALYFIPNQCAPRQVLQVGYLDVILDMVGQGMGISILSQWLLQSKQQERVTWLCKPLTPAPQTLQWDLLHQPKSGTDQIAALIGDLLCQRSATPTE
ncbi:LysR family transcriptional regulator [Ferrimonas pelagia]|uniref:LysR family transcriptional regulator n=1 Tax=Ferrimonas pelagia TaxID=1177826 RepID=A0ABP9EUM6_9GAMM